MNKVTPGYNDIITFTESKTYPMYLQGYGFRVKRRDGRGQVMDIDVFSTRTSPSWSRLAPNQSGGYTLGGNYCTKKYLLSVAQHRVDQLAKSDAVKETMASMKTTLINQAIVFSESKGVSQMFKAGTSLDEVVEVLEKRSIEIDSSFKVFYPKTGLVKNLVAVPQKVVLRFE
jgi:hypothetical protein